VADVILALLLTRAVVVCARSRHAPPILAALAGLALWAMLAASGWISRAAVARGLWGAVYFVSLGPSSLPGPAAAVPLSGLAGAHPIAAHALVALVLGAGVVSAWRHAGRVSELSDEAVRRKGVALTLLVPTLLFAVETATFALAEVAAL
jgi:hypothetical protein